MTEKRRQTLFRKLRRMGFCRAAGKVKFRSRGQALFYARSILEARYGNGYRAYRCPDCHHDHLTKRVDVHDRKAS